MKKDEVLKIYKPICEQAGFENIGKIIYETVGTVYDRGFEEGVKSGIELNQEVNDRIIKGLLTKKQ